MQVNNAQDYTRQLKNRVIAKQYIQSPAPVFREYNSVYIAVKSNAANQVVRQISAPTRYVDNLTSFRPDATGQKTSDCCVGTTTAV
jgi:hypothetical protein